MKACEIRGFGPWAARTAACALCGFCLSFTFPPRELWFAAPLFLAGLLVLLRPELVGPRRRRTGLWPGYAFGLGFFLPLLSWTGIFVGSGPWLALSAFLSLYTGVFGWIAVRLWPLRFAPFFIASAWTACEWFRGSWPFGGFPWGRLAFGQAGGLLAPAAALGGASFLSFVVAFIAAGVARGVPRERAGRGWAAFAAAAAVLSGCVLAGRAALPDPDGGQRLRVAAVQGGVPKLGLDFNDRPAAVLMMHVQESLDFAREEQSRGGPRAALVVWPENASDIDPVLYPWAGDQITGAARALGAPILVGTLDTKDPQAPRNTVLVWEPGSGPVDRHDKSILQPFGEYLPMRSFFRLFSSYADRAGSFVPGAGDGVVRAPLADGRTVPVGVATCYEVIFDRALVGAVRDGAQILAVPSNNATFGDSDMTYQQLAASRIRAVELGRSVVVSATTGVSAIIGPDGRVLAQSGKITPAWLVADVPLRSGRTPASEMLPWTDVVLLVSTFAGFILSARHGRLAQSMRGWPSPQTKLTASGERSPRNRENMSDSKPDEVAGSFSPTGGEGGTRPTGRTLVIVPTYNERENIVRILPRLFTANPHVEALVVDDGSPDGTGAIVDELAQDEPRLHVMHRTGKGGLGSAYIAGFRWGLERGFAVLVEMDADGSHAPEQLPRLLERVDAGADLVIGSRYVPGGTVVNWPKQREVLSRGANVYAKLALGTHVQDITGGFRAYRAQVLRAIDLDAVESRGYCFQIDLAWRAQRAGFAVAEVPITFTEREIGYSKMSKDIIFEAFFKVARWGFDKRILRRG
ncbi:apolipoprotein N-acyltransferase [Segniliparus rotundus DSM 44985]|uniref:Apolipoprotein N-acyltransferase n=1 Tax=Segniliparus rotundus (strain ATCC BAA-972 / CDC 1076 / CIP 108378 / DSM 44985 / JCM 13578) TaxID=640132 RepID=D6Z8E5_SEGRD|nr:apolipoprotein N-acyltransferase [Segniliparus rotundus]ADG98225.1 apolipoprotein N-acyltransferase [Segniliparus rotundus DSM 44985]